MTNRGELHGATPAAVETAIRAGTPFTDDAGFAGELPDGRLVRDVLGRYPIFVDGSAWAFSPTELASPTAVPPGTVVTKTGSEQVWSLPEPSLFATDREAITHLDTAIRETCDAIDPDNTAIGFSGGVDSALLAAHTESPLFTIGFPGESDLTAATTAATAMERTCVPIELTHNDLQDAVPIVARATGRTNAMDIAIGCSLYLLAAHVAKEGYEILALGQGADELFGGYEKIAHLDHRVAADTVLDARREVVLDMEAGLERDILAIRAAGVEPTFPFLGDGVVAGSLRLDGSQLVRDGTRKWILREIARPYLPDRIANQDKRALQYGSGVAKELDRLARQAGYKRRMDRHVEQYVQSLVAR